ncbi:hypothetical protein BH11MYX4_BH11MYX4_42300 [soil metagenome]
MSESWPASADRPLVNVLRALSVPGGRVERAGGDPGALFERAELHGLAGVVHDAWLEAGHPLPEALARKLEGRRVARDLDHGAHLAILHRVNRARDASDLRAVVLKGPLFAERFYARPSARATSDIDLRGTEGTVDAAAAALATVGYLPDAGPREAWFRREHHHLHLSNPHALPLELHFHAYRGFGRTMRSEPLLARSLAAPDALKAISVLAAVDEVVYLAVHAAAHRFVRLGWLYDLVLLIASMTDEALRDARGRARTAGYGRALALAAELLHDVLGVERAALLGHLGAVRSPLVHGVVSEPRSPVLRSATRFLYTTSLCDSPGAAARYAARAALDHAKQLLGAAP